MRAFLTDDAFSARPHARLPLRHVCHKAAGFNRGRDTRNGRSWHRRTRHGDGTDYNDHSTYTSLPVKFGSTAIAILLIRGPFALIGPAGFRRLRPVRSALIAW
jgi:hypothetical protein